MNSTLQKFGHFIIARRADGANVELRRTPSEVVFLAFDTSIKRLVELHVLTATAALNATDRSLIHGICKLATEVRRPSCMRVLETGEEEHTLYFSSNLSDGELAEDYVARRGALPQVTVFCLMQQFLDDLLSIPKLEDFVAYVSLANPLITTLEDSFLQLRIVDYRLSGPDAITHEDSRSVVSECCHLLFLLLTGQPFGGQNPDQIPALTSLPTNLRTTMRTALMGTDQASPFLDKFRDDVREAYSALVSNLQLRTSRRHIVVTESLQPKSQLKDVLLGQAPLDDLLNGRFEPVTGDEGSRHPFSIPSINPKTEQPITVHLLPPSGIVPKDEYEAVPLQMWRFDPDKHPNILRSLSVWENPAWTFLTEEREPGFSLGRLMAERITLNPPEVLAILRQVRCGLDQAMECGVRSADLHPSNLMLKVGKGGPTQSREFERLMQKRLDAWPPFLVKLRTHMTMRSLYEPPLVELPEGSTIGDLHLAERELRHRAFLGLAVYLLTGERQGGTSPTFSEAVPESLASYLRTCLEPTRQFDRAPSPTEFVEAFEQHMAQSSPEGRGIAAIMAAGGASGGEVENAGAISDFDDDFSEDDGDSKKTAAPNYLLTGSTSRKSFNVAPLPEPRQTVPGRMGMYLWAATVLVLALVVRFVVFSSGHSAATESAHPGEVPSVAAARSTTAPVVAARFSSAPDVSALTSLAVKTASLTPPSKPVSTAGMAGSEPSTPSASNLPVSHDNLAASTAPASKLVSTTTVASAPKPTTAPAPASQSTASASPPSKPSNAPAASEPPHPAAPASKEPSETPITIKKAIVPSNKEVGEAKKGGSNTAPSSDGKPATVDLVDGSGGRFR